MLGRGSLQLNMTMTKCSWLSVLAGSLLLCILAMSGCAQSKLTPTDLEREQIMHDPHLNQAQRFEQISRMSASGSNPLDAQRNRIMSDPTLTPNQKAKELVHLAPLSLREPAINSDSLPSIILYCMSGCCFLACIVLLVRSPIEATFGEKGRKRANKESARSKAAVPLAPSMAAAIIEPQGPRFPGSQAEVNAIPDSDRGVSFFSSRPIPQSMLVEIRVVLDGVREVFLATPQEAELVQAGRPPFVRAFSVHGETRPWFDWPNYDPYAQYWSAANSDWVMLGEDVIACWLSLDELAAPRPQPLRGASEQAPAPEPARSDFAAPSPKTSSCRKRRSRRPYFVVRSRRIAPCVVRRRFSRTQSELLKLRARLEKACRMEPAFRKSEASAQNLREVIGRIEGQIRTLETHERRLPQRSAVPHDANNLRARAKWGAPSVALCRTIASPFKRSTLGRSK